MKMIINTDLFELSYENTEKYNQVNISNLTSQGVAYFADSIPHVFMTFGISLKEFTIQV